MKHMKYQGGLTTIGWLAAILVLAFALTCAIKIGPIYMESFTVKGIVEAVGEEAAAKNLSPAEARKLISKRFTINTVKGINIKEVLVTRKADKLTIDANYEVRTPLISNIDVVVVFDDFIFTFTPKQ